MPPRAKPTPPVQPLASPAFQTALLTWYDAGHRPLPWRATASPYELWVAETMLQQTTVAAVIPYYQRFLHRFPTLPELAAAPLEDVLHLWQGLGYYRRACLLHRGAQVLVHEHGGIFPRTPAELAKLPGLGPYTSAVIAACAFEEPAVVIDGNVVRVLTRLLAHPSPVTPTHKLMQTTAAQLCAGAPPRRYANAIMELGATLCTPRAPRCPACPVHSWCRAAKLGTPTAFPVIAAKAPKPLRHGVAYVLTDPHGRLWLRQRPPEGLLGGLWEVPHTGWEATPFPATATLPELQDCGTIQHTFTHFQLHLEVRAGESAPLAGLTAFAPHQLPPLSSLMKKVLRAAGHQLEVASSL